MPPNDLTIDDLCILLVLLAEAREIDNNEMDETYGLRLTGKPKERLNRRKLVASRQVKGSLLGHRLTPEGRAVCDEALATRLGHGGGPKVAALSALLLGLARHLKNEGKSSLAEIFRADEPTLSPVRPPSGEDGIETSLRRAYQSVTGTERRYVRLEEVRVVLSHIPKSELDRTLKQLAKAKRIHLAPDDYRGSLSTAQRAAAITFGGRQNHLIMIED
jgi:hypothetical protein